MRWAAARGRRILTLGEREHDFTTAQVVTRLVVARLGWVSFNTECGRKILTLGERVRVSLPGNYPMVFQHSPLCGPGA
jgi:hypothetical protein